MKRREVRQGECLSSIAEEEGFTWTYLWNLQENSDLRQRGDPNVLYPGDVVHIPEARPRSESKATEARHAFRRKGVPVSVRLLLREGATPLSDQPCDLTIGATAIEGRTDGKGYVEFLVPPAARRAALRIGAHREPISLELGVLDPVSESRGVQARLNNLGFPCGRVDGIIGPLTQAALRAFQETHGLELSGTPDRATRNCLVAEHGS